jgi:transcriptional regulator with XRE-family HTH domain
MGLELINKLRRERKLKAEELAHKSGVPLGTLNKILNGQTKNPSLETVFALAHALDCSVDDFDDGESTKSGNPFVGLPDEIQDLILKWDKLSNGNRLKITGMIDIKLAEQEE